jgi:transcriptional regulator with XRE-family HTH domain
MANAFGPLLKEWRETRRLSQLDFAAEAGISARHVSFLESGRSRPSPGMVMRLAEVLRMPRSAANQAMLAAGFAPAFGRGLPEADLAPARAAVAHLLDRHMPWPAVAFDSGWTVVGTNPAAVAMLSAAGMADEPNLVRALINEAGQSAVVNWDEVAWLTAARLRAELAAQGKNDGLSALLLEMKALDRFRRIDAGRIDLDRAVIPVRMRAGAEVLSLFSMVAGFGSVLDPGLSDLHVELFFPADPATGEWFGGTGPAPPDARGSA